MTDEKPLAYTVADISAVVCTLNSISSIEQCLASLRAAGVGEVIVVDATSTDGTYAIAERMADLVLTDPGHGLGAARNLGIARTSKPLILNMGSDNLAAPHALERMIAVLSDSSAHNLRGVSAQTLIDGDSYLASGLNAWRRGRFLVGPAAVIGTPTLFIGDTLRAHPYDSSRRFSDDSELCERWTREFAASFAITDAIFYEIGKTSWDEIRVRCRMYGISDYEVFADGNASGWSAQRKAQSLLHPARVDLVHPLRNLKPVDAAKALPFLLAFTAMRYESWATRALRSRGAAGSDAAQ
ncbi:MAG TPA: hypothetical protein DDY88_05110 [Actinobacteria bacterium]|nr:hypothetical protein [Actinomycetota bacterium]